MPAYDRPIAHAALCSSLALGLLLFAGCSSETEETDAQSESTALLEEPAATTDSPPHIIVISVDTLRADRMGLLGSDHGTSPQLDRFFSEGTVFENAFSASPCTLPSVPQFLYGRYALSPQAIPLAEILFDAGYATRAVASQHHFAALEQGQSPSAHLRRAIRRGFERFDIQSLRQLDEHGLSTRTASEVTDRALARVARRPKKRPLFLWLHYFDPHDPYEPPPDFTPTDAGNPSPISGDRRALVQAARMAGAEIGEGESGDLFSAQDVARLRSLYDGEVRYTDAEIGRFLTGLEAAGLVENSIIVLLADHGEWLGEEGRWDHCMTPRELEVAVPFFWRVRGGPLAGSPRLEGAVSTLDLAPTLLELAGIDAAAYGFSGVDLRATSPDRIVISHWQRTTAAHRADWSLLVDERSARLTQRGFDAWEPALPGDAQAGSESTHSPTSADALDRFGQGLEVESALRDAVARFRVDNQLDQQNDDIFEQLRALGYIQ